MLFDSAARTGPESEAEAGGRSNDGGGGGDGGGSGDDGDGDGDDVVGDAPARVRARPSKVLAKSQQLYDEHATIEQRREQRRKVRKLGG